MRTKCIVILFMYSILGVAQNDMDALRYSQTGIGGNARFMTMGGAFGALGGNTSCLSYNPAGIGIFRKGEINISPGLRFAGTKSNYNGFKESGFAPSLIFTSGFGIAGSWQSQKKEDVRHSLGIVQNQLQNFENEIVVNGIANGKSIIDDIKANAGSQSLSSLDPSYSGMAYDEYLLDVYSNGTYYGFIDPTKNMLQNKAIKTSGKMNEFAAGYTYGFRDKFYFGASLGIPTVSYDYSSVYTESDSYDSLRIYRDGSNVIRDTYSYPVAYYVEDTINYNLIGGFKSMTYSEAYKTTGRGYNLKLGIIYRMNDYLRLGANYQTPTVLKLTDVYSYSMTTTFDGGMSYAGSYPENGGIYTYRVVTPARFGASIGFIYKKLLCLGLDYETVDYGGSWITSADEGVFTDVNTTIRSKYNRSSNVRAGLEVNVKSVMFRLGYASYGSPFGQSFTGDFVKTTISGGIGFRAKKWTFDFGLVNQKYKDDYYMYNPKYSDKATISFSGTTFVSTIGCKF